jgi:Ca2+-transporting ATPase
MTVLEAWISGPGKVSVPADNKLFPAQFSELLSVAVSANTDANISLDEKKIVVHLGNKTECALLQMVEGLGRNYAEVREKNAAFQRYHFTSLRKMMSTAVVLGPGSQRLYVKGASEIVLGRCTHVHRATGAVEVLGEKEKEQVSQSIQTMASSGLRTLGIAYRNLAADESDEAYWNALTEESLTLVAVVGIKDPIRPETAEAVRLLRGAGVSVRMVTGDNVLTAMSIAREAGILDEGGLVLEGPEFRRMSLEQQKAVALKIQARGPLAHCRSVRK